MNFFTYNLKIPSPLLTVVPNYPRIKEQQMQIPNRWNYTLTLTFLLLLILFVSLSTAARKIVNHDNSPLAVVQLTNADGSYQTATIYITPKGEMLLGDSGWPIKGAGYLEAVPDRSLYIGFQWGIGKFGGIRVKKIEWDNTGKLVSISGLGPTFEYEPDLKFTSDLSKPTIRDGVLYLRLEGKGNQEYAFKTLFGKGLVIEPGDL